jgi:carboxypeptidase family protein
MRGLVTPVLAAALLPCLLQAQGITTAAVQGAVTREDGSPIAEAQVEVTNSSTGERWELQTGARGRYYLESATIGGPYRIAVHAVGFEPASRGGMYLSLGQRYTVDFSLKVSVYELPEIAVVQEVDPLINPGRTGPEQIVPESTIARLPNPIRDLLIPQLTSPLVNFAPTGGISIAGQNDFFNSIQIDGGVNNDLYLGGGPGQGITPTIISVNAVKEFQVLAAPFDVRAGSFVGGLFNAVTKSGTNEVRGSAFAYFQNQGLVGDGPTGNPVRDFATWQLGGSVAGPVKRDRLHYFVNVEAQRRVFPDLGPLITDTAGGADSVIGVQLESAERFQRILSDTYGLAPGSLGASDRESPNVDLLAKLTAQIGRNSTLELSHHFQRGVNRGFVPRGPGAYYLSSVSEQDRANANTSRLIWNALLGRQSSNELVVTYLRLRDACHPETDYPQIIAAADQGQLVAGSDPSCLTTRIDQDAVEVTDNVTVAAGDHLLTMGTHDEFLHFRDPFLLESQGLWFFEGLDELEAGQAASYERGLAGPLRPEGPIVDFRVRQLGLYVQDRWAPSSRLTLTGGLRVDVPFLPDDAVTNPALEASLGLDTGELPGGNPLWSPRLAVTYDAGGGRTFLRGGVGLFSGRPPYRWIANAYRGSGGEESLLTCAGEDVPAFDPLNQPETCGSGPTVTQRVTVFDPAVRFPQNLKVSLGVDHRLPWDLVATVDLLYTRGTHQFYYDDANLVGPVGTAPGEGNRPLYGTLDPDGTANPARVDPAFGPVVRVTNRSGDRAFSATGQLQRRFGSQLELNASYTYARSQDYMSLFGRSPFGNLSLTPLDGTLADRGLSTSTFETQHRLWLSGTVRLPLGVDFSLTYLGFSGSPFTYAVAGDPNADGIGVAFDVWNDPVYVPRNAVPGGDIQLVVEDAEGNLAPAPPEEYDRLAAFIDGEPCLRQQRGSLLQRNSCVNPWVTFTTARVAKTFRTWGGQSIELEASVFNLLNLLDADWGHVRGTTDQPAVQLLRLVGYDEAYGRGIYQFEAPPREQIVDGVSRWRMLTGLRYVF